MKTVLIISYHFPPDTSVGGRRPAKFARYLPSFGWRPLVLTVDPRYHEATDKTHPPEAASVEHTGMMPSFEDAYRWLKRRLSRPGGVPPAPSAGSAMPKPRSFLRSLGLALMYLPDKQLPWVPFAVARGLQITSRRRIHAIFTTSPPNSVQIAGALLHGLTGIPWLADLRDPWTNEAQPDYQRTAIARLLNAPIERATLAHADRIITVTDEMHHYYRSLLDRGIEHFHLIHNGYDPSDFPQPPVPQAGGPLTLRYLGSFYHSRDPRWLLEAAGQLIARGEAAPGQLRIEFIGHCAQTPSGPIDQMIATNGLQGVAEAIAWMPHREALGRMQAADVALLFAPRQKMQVPAKLFEYIGARKPVLALTEPDGSTGRLVGRARCGRVVDQRDVDGIARVLKELLEQKRRGPLAFEPDGDALALLDVRRQAELLAHVLNEATYA